MIRVVPSVTTIHDILRDARMSISTAYVTGGSDAALAAVAAASVRLAHHASAGLIHWPASRKMLVQVSCNLKLPIIYGRSAVHVAINAGPNLYEQFSEAA